MGQHLPLGLTGRTELLFQMLLGFIWSVSGLCGMLSDQANPKNRLASNCPLTANFASGTCERVAAGAFGIFEFFQYQKMISCIFYQVNLTGSGIFK